MSFDPNVSNRLHRSGAIDFNVAFDLRFANIHKSGKTTKTKRSYEGGGSIEADSLSVCEGEPLYQKCEKKAKFGGGCAMTRKPIQLLSSLNGVQMGEAEDRGMVEELFKHAKAQSVTSTAEQLSGHGATEVRRPVQHVKQDTMSEGGRLLEEFQTKGYSTDAKVALACDFQRNMYFKSIKPTGVSVTKWDFGTRGKQGDLFVATLGGANTVYVDEDVYAGDTIIVDLPLEECDGQGSIRARMTKDSEHGFVECQKKRGIPNAKRTLVVRSLPTLGNLRNIDIETEKKLISNFYRRHQVLGQCTKGAKKGERCDLVLGKNSIGV